MWRNYVKTANATKRVMKKPGEVLWLQVGGSDIRTAIVEVAAFTPEEL
jgi:hypothetical protein